jgi:transcriptional regulator with XRE-family HTH domain
VTTATRTGRSGRPPIPADAFEHGDPRRYWRGCRCKPCRRGVTAQIQKRKYFRDTGRGWLRDPGAARLHLDRLRAAGMTEPEIRTAAHITEKQARHSCHAAGRIHADTERRILSVPVPRRPERATPVSRALVPAHGTLRRLRALTAAGWHQAEVARRLGWHTSYLGHMMRGRTGPSVAWCTAAAVADLYNRLACLRPEDHGVPASRAQRARDMAAERGWSDATYWEDYGGIDDPQAPETEEARALKRDELAALRREEILHLASFGIPEHEIAARLGMAQGYVHDLIKAMRGAA